MTNGLAKPVESLYVQQTFPEGVRRPHLEFELCKLDVNRPFSTHSGIDVTYCSIKLADVAELADARLRVLFPLLGVKVRPLSSAFFCGEPFAHRR